MKSFIPLLALLLAFATAPHVVGQVIDLEPNNTRATATPFELDTTLVGQLSADTGNPDYEDWFTFTSPGNGSLTLTIDPSEGHTVRLQLWNMVSDWEMMDVYDVTNQPFSLHYPNLKEGRYAIRVSNLLNSSGSYEITTTFSRPSRPDGEDPEPNNTPQTARPVALNEAFTGHLGYSNGIETDDQDWMMFNVPTDGSLRIHGIPDSTAAIIFHLWREQETYDNTTFFAEEGHGIYVGQEKTLHIPNLQAGTYYLRMQSSTRYGSYETTIGFMPANPSNPADVEPNDLITDASPLLPNGNFTGHLGFTNGTVTDYIDIFRFETTAAGDAMFVALPDSSLGLGMTLLGSDGVTVVAAAGHSLFTGQPVQLFVPNLIPGTYYLHFACGVFQQGTYSFHLSTADTLIDPPEPLLSGRITNAVNGEPISGAFVMIGGVETVTDSTGTYRFFELPEAPVSVTFVADTTVGTAPFPVTFTSELLPGVFTIHVVAEGYSPFSFNGLTLGGSMVFNASLSPDLTDTDLRFVLNWGADPRDLDSHVLTPDSSHVYYGMTGSSTEPPFVVLDHDITSGYGPETVSFIQLIPGTYTYYVHLYAGVGTIATSSAVVQIYDRDGLLMSVTPPSDGATPYWLVASVDGSTGRVTVLNRYADADPSGSLFQKSIPKSTPQSAIAAEWTYSWQFGDDQTSLDPHPTHAYTQPGLYSVGLDVSHPDGRSAYFLRRDYIEVLADTTEPEPIEYVLSGRVIDAATGEPIAGAFVMVEGSSETMTDSTGFYGFTELLDPTTQMSFSADVTQGLAPLSVTFTPSFRDGFYTVRAFAEGYGYFVYTDLAADTLMVFDVRLDAMTQDTTAVNKTARTNTTSTGDWQFFWGFGDGSTSEASNPTHVYTEPGLYSIFAEAIDTLGGRFVHAFRENYIQVDEDTTVVQPLLSGRVTDAVNGQPIVGASVMIGSLATLTDSAGVYAFFELPEAPTQVEFAADSTYGEAPLTVRFQSWVRDGYHSIVVRADGFDEFAYHSLVVDGPTEFDLSLSPTLVLADMRIVLNWGATPRDLDSHIRTPDGHHVYYSNQGDHTAPPFTTLDHDVVEGYGPETITLVQRRSGSYAYYIHNYSGEADITTSSAVVRFYDAQGLLMSVDVPAEGTGLYWYVADIDGETGRITLINRIQETEPGASATEKAVAKAPVRSTQVDWTYAWEFGDGGVSDLAHPEHTYTQAGTYSVSVSATLGERNARMTRRDYIHVTEPVRIIQAVNDTVTVVAGTIVRIDPMANDRLPDTLAVYMELGNAALNYGMLMMTTDHVGLIYASVVNAVGIDSIRYTLHFEGGQTSATIFLHVVEGVVRNQAPVVALPVEISILEDSTMVIPMRKLVFDDHDTAAQLDIRVASVNPAVSVLLTEAKDTLRISALPNWWGTSVLTLTATDRDGGVTTDHVTLTFIPVNDAPVAIFLKQAETLTDDGLVVDFIDQSHDALDPEGAITAWAWDFGDGHTSSQRHPSHTYTVSGTFTVRLSVTDNAGMVSHMETTVVSEFTSVEQTERITEFALQGAYPNPFNPTTRVRVDVPETGDVMVDVYTMMGQRVASRRETLSAGRHSIEIDALGWSSGVYLYTVRYRDQMVSSKMTLIK